MDYTMLFSVWAVAITGPCVVCWLAGHMRGAARIHRLYESEPAAPATSASAMRVEPWRIPGSVFPLPSFGSVEDQTARTDPCAEEQALEAERRRQLRVALISGPERSERPDRTRSGHRGDVRANWAEAYPETALFQERRFGFAMDAKSAFDDQPSWSAFTLV